MKRQFIPIELIPPSPSPAPPPTSLLHYHPPCFSPPPPIPLCLTCESGKITKHEISSKLSHPTALPATPCPPPPRLPLLFRKECRLNKKVTIVKVDATRPAVSFSVFDVSIYEVFLFFLALVSTSATSATSSVSFHNTEKEKERERESKKERRKRE